VAVIGGWIIREATEGDALAIAEVHVAAWREAYAALVPKEMIAALSIEERSARWRQMLTAAHPRAAAFLATEGDVPVGFSSCGPQRSSDLASLGFKGEITAVYVLRRAQRRGMGASLMRAAARRLASDGHDGAALWVLRDNMPARRFYEALGGTLVSAREDRRGEHVLHEVAYGWRDLNPLLAA
jgi:ribosomal protein S18 acetylase RimI-like enzyme